MMRIDNGTAFTSKIFELTENDIEIIVGLLNEECDHHVYHQDAIRKQDQEFFKERYDHIQDMILELTKK